MAQDIPQLIASARGFLTSQAYGSDERTVLIAIVDQLEKTHIPEKRVAEVMSEDGGCWTACSGCQESDEGHVSIKYYPYNPVFQCQPGGGCSECGGIGVLWQDGVFLASYGDCLTPDHVADAGKPIVGEARTREIAAFIYAEVADEPLGDLMQRRQAVQDTWHDAVRAALSGGAA